MEKKNKLWTGRIDTPYGQGSFHVAAETKGEAISIARKQIEDAIIIEDVVSIPQGELDFD
jgi:hypothetical protein